MARESAPDGVQDQQYQESNRVTEGSSTPRPARLTLQNGVWYASYEPRCLPTDGDPRLIVQSWIERCAEKMKQAGGQS